MQLSKWLADNGWSAGALAKEYEKRFPKTESVSRQLMNQYAKGHPMPPDEVRRNLEKLTKGAVSETDWAALAKKLGKIRFGSGKWRRPDGQGDAREIRKKTRKASSKAARKAKKPARSSGAIL